MSVDGFNRPRSSLIVVCPITATPSAYPLHVAVDAGKDVYGCVCVEALAAVDPVARHFESTGAFASDDAMAQILELIGGVFGI